MNEQDPYNAGNTAGHHRIRRYGHPPEMETYIKHTVGQNEACPAGLYVALTDGSLYHASFVPGPDFDAASKSWYQDGIASEKFISLSSPTWV